MLTYLRIKNFKAWADTRDIRLAPLTVLFGSNSSGKSSLGHLLLALKQTVLSTDRKRALHLGDANSLIDLGTFADCLHGHDMSLPLSFDLRWRVPGGITVRNALASAKARQFTGDQIELGARILATSSQQPETEKFHYRLISADTRILEVIHSRKNGGGDLTSEPLRLVHATGRK